MNPLTEQYLNRIEKDYGQHTAFRYFEQGEIRSVSYAQFVKDVYCAADGFRDYQGGHIAILARNSYAYIVNLFGIMAAGAVTVTLNIEEGWDVLHGQLELTEPALILHDGEYLTEHPSLGEYSGMLRMLEVPSGNIRRHTPVHDNPDELALLMFTSGTTSVGKCVMLPHRCFWENAKAFLPEKAAVSCFLCNPLNHIGGIICVMGWLKSGCEICLNSDMRFLRKELIQFGCTHSFFVPKVLEFLNRYIKKGKLSELGMLKTVTTGTASAAYEILQSFATVGISVIQTYGLSESGAKGTSNFLLAEKTISSVGYADPGVEISIQNGEICLKGDCIMLGYYKNPEATAEALQDGWLHTGDLGYLDEDGYLYITGRKKNLIILSTGENVNPEELEGLLMRSPDVQETLVVEKNNRICALVYCGPEKQEAVRRYVDEINTQVAIYKRIGLVEFREEPFPRTASGKIKRG